MTSIKFTLDIEPSSPESTVDDDAEDEDSVNQIVEISDSETNKKYVDISDCIIPTQNCTVVPSTPIINQTCFKPVNDLHEITKKIKTREEVVY